MRSSIESRSPGLRSLSRRDASRLLFALVRVAAVAILDYGGLSFPITPSTS